LAFALLATTLCHVGRALSPVDFSLEIGLGQTEPVTQSAITGNFASWPTVAPGFKPHRRAGNSGNLNVADHRLLPIFEFVIQLYFIMLSLAVSFERDQDTCDVQSCAHRYFK
jgi:hypothetical protein